MIGPWHGDPCSRCVDRRMQGLVPRVARMHGMCMPCWLGATETQRRAAIFDEAADDLFTSEQIKAEALAVAQLRKDLEQWGMAA